ncbi:MAG: 4a-hydroxytetrahydrobiopterin dehydratase [Kiritimatiellia bacterium]
MDTCNLADRTCIPCKGGIPSLPPTQQQRLLEQLPQGWEVINAHHLQKTYRFPDFTTALAFTNRAGHIAESQNHHPEITLTWGVVTIRIWTHKIDALTESDFILAAKIDAAL